MTSYGHKTRVVKSCHHWPEKYFQFGCTIGRLFAFKGNGRLVCLLQALLHFSQHALVDVRLLIGWSDLMHAVESSSLPLTVACIHWGEVNCSNNTGIWFYLRVKHSLTFWIIINTLYWCALRKQIQGHSSGTIDVKRVAVFWTLVSTLAEEVNHLLWLPTEHQLSTTHYGNPAEHLRHKNKPHYFVSVQKYFMFSFRVCWHTAETKI